jgi:predicted nucleic acid-binding protein
MIGLDCNILVQLAFADHPANAKAIAAVEAQGRRGEALILPPLIVTEFLHVVTDSRRFSPPLTMTEAIGWIEGFRSNPSVRQIQPSEESLLQTLRWMREFQLGRKRILDTYLAAVLHTNGVRRLMTSNPADFEVFGVLELLVP